MILTARRSLVHKMARNQAPKIEIFFLNISVRRANVSTITWNYMNLNFPPSFFGLIKFFHYFFLQIVSDSLKEISEKQKDLKKKLKVSFVGEPGLGKKIISCLKKDMWNKKPASNRSKISPIIYFLSRYGRSDQRMVSAIGETNIRTRLWHVCVPSKF